MKNDLKEPEVIHSDTREYLQDLHNEVHARMINATNNPKNLMLRYKCDVCGRLYDFKYQVNRCKEIHACNHQSRYDMCKDGSIRRSCKICGTVFGYADVINALEQYPEWMYRVIMRKENDG